MATLIGVMLDFRVRGVPTAIVADMLTAKGATMRTIHAAAAAIRSGSLTPIDLVEECLVRVDALEERVRAWVFLDRDGARREAERLTDELRRGQNRGPLHGIPVGVKDIFDVFDWPTAAGSKVWANAYARKDAPVVDRLRRAGAVLLGKTVTTAYASFDPPVTRNPWDISRTPGGSSSGSAAAVACGMCLGALASQTGGSITRPASFCGVTGAKPTYGRISLDGIVPLAPSMDHPGVMAGDVRGLAILLDVIEAGPASPTLGRLRGFFDDHADPAMRSAMDELCEKLRSAGVEVRDLAPPGEFAEVTARHRVVMAVEAATFHEARFRKRPDDYPPRIASLIEEGLRTPATEYARALEYQQLLITAMRRSFGEVSVLLTPATVGVAPPAETTGDPVFNSPWSLTGLPTVSFPIAWSGGLPLCAQLVGRSYGEAELFAVAARAEEIAAFERREVAAG